MANATETALLSYIFTAVAPSWAAATELDLHLHTADPGDAGTTATNEATYTSYALVTVDRAIRTAAQTAVVLLGVTRLASDEALLVTKVSHEPGRSQPTKPVQRRVKIKDLAAALQKS